MELIAWFVIVTFSLAAPAGYLRPHEASRVVAVVTEAETGLRSGFECAGQNKCGCSELLGSLALLLS
jgi:hypothetical protein